MLEMAPGVAVTLKVRINDLSSHHQNQRFILVAGPADAPIRGSRSVPIEIMSKPRVEDKGDAEPAGGKRALEGDGGGDGPDAKRLALPQAGLGAAGGQQSLFAALAAVTDPNPTPERQVDLSVALLDGLAPAVKAGVAAKLAVTLDKKAKMQLLDLLANDLKFDGAPVDAGDGDKPKPKHRLKSLAKAIVEFKRNEKGGRVRRAGDTIGGPNGEVLSEEQLNAFFVDEESGINIFDTLSPKNGAAPKN